MKSTYVLTVETNLTKKLRGNFIRKVYEKNIRVFEDFEVARTSMLSVIEEFAKSENDIFDGYGNFIGFDEEFKCAIEEAEEMYDESDNLLEYVKNAPDILVSHFLGVEVHFSDEFFEEFGACDFEISDVYSGWCDISFSWSDPPQSLTMNYFYHSGCMSFTPLLLCRLTPLI